MKLRGFIAEDFVNYKIPSMFLASTTCDWKGCVEQGMSPALCQNESLASSPIIDITDDSIYSLFSANDIAQAVVVGGLEPMLQFDELDRLISTFRGYGEMCDFVIYTGYYPEEIQRETSILARHRNVIIKYGRYVPNRLPVYDEVLGITLASDNQFARRIS